MKHLFLIPILCFLSLEFTHADETSDGPDNHPYRFTGSCTSQGSWTQAALSHTDRLREIAKQLKNDQACKSVGLSLQGTLNDLQKELSTAADSEARSNTLASLPQEISAITSTMASGTFMKTALSRLIFGKMMTLSTQENQHQQDNPQDPKPGMSVPTREVLLQSFQERMRRASTRGFTLFNNTLDYLPQLNTCLIDSNGMGQFLAASVSMLGSLVSSGQDSIGNQMAMTISKLSNYMREKRFSNVLRNLNQTEFLSSVSCLMEITSESYCSTRDGRILFNEMVRQISPRMYESTDKSIGPLAGYYILSQQVPIISNWLYKIQIGTTPRRETDAAFQTGVLRSVNAFFVLMKHAEGLYYNQMLNMKAYSDVSIKQNLLRETVLKLAELMIGSPQNDTNENFFTKANSPIEIYFRLIGMDVPAIVQGTTGQAPWEPDDWINKNYASIPEFSNPDDLAIRIERNLREILDKATSAAVAYYNQNFIVDQIGIVNESLLGMNYNVKDALINIDKYLKGLKYRIEKTARDKTMIASIVETRIRIGRVLARYEKLRVYSENLKKLESLNDQKQMLEQLRLLNVALITEVYDQFQVLLARTGWLANRMSTFVWYDYQNILRPQFERDSQFFSRHTEELFRASGQLAFDRMLAMGSGNPSNVDTDLTMALRLSKENIASMEMLLKDSISQMINALQLSASDKKINSTTTSYDSIKRSFEDQWTTNAPGDERSFGKRLWNSLIIPGRTIISLESTKYPVSIPSLVGLNNKTVYSNDDEFKSASKLRQQLCIQALAFNDLSLIWANCQDAVLRSPFTKSQVTAEFAQDFDKSLNVSFSEKAKERLQDQRGLNHSIRICAFRDYNRKNLVAYLALLSRNAGSSNSNSNYKSEFMEVEETTPAAYAPTPPPKPKAQGDVLGESEDLP